MITVFAQFPMIKSLVRSHTVSGSGKNTVLGFKAMFLNVNLKKLMMIWVLSKGFSGPKIMLIFLFKRWHFSQFFNDFGLQFYHQSCLLMNNVGNFN